MLNIVDNSSEEKMRKTSTRRPPDGEKNPTNTKPIGRKNPGGKKTISQEAKAIGDRIKHFRDARGMSNAELGEAIGLGENAVIKINSGESCTKYADLAGLAKALGVTPNDILGFPSNVGSAELRGAIAASYVPLGLSMIAADKLARTVLSTLEGPPIQSVHMDTETAARVQSEQVTRAFLAKMKKGN